MKKRISKNAALKWSQAKPKNFSFAVSFSRDLTRVSAKILYYGHMGTIEYKIEKKIEAMLARLANHGIENNKDFCFQWITLSGRIRDIIALGSETTIPVYDSIWHFKSQSDLDQAMTLWRLGGEI